MNLVGYKLSGQDNDTSMFTSDDQIAKCDVCGYKTDFSSINPNYVPKAGTRDFSATYDGYRIVSARFREVCLRLGYADLTFAEFRTTNKFFAFIPRRVVKFDAKRRCSRFEKRCHACGNYESIVGAKPAFLLTQEPLLDDFFRSDLLFGSGDGKHSLIFVGVKTKAELQKSKLRGLEFAPAHGLDLNSGSIDGVQSS